MHRVTRAAIAAAAVSLLALGGSTAASGAPAIPLNNGQETTDAKFGAHGSFTYDIDGDQFCYTLEVTDLTAPPLFAHVHLGQRMVAGGILIHLHVENATSFAVDECTTADAGLLADIAANPGDYYVNVHTPMFPGGEVRGQLK